MAGRRGRPPLGADLVDARDGDEIAKLRLKLILETMLGRITVREAADTLGNRESAFQKLRRRFLDDALELLAPRRVGRPQKEECAHAGEIRDLRQKVARLERQLSAAQASEEVAMILSSVDPDAVVAANPSAKKEKTREAKRTRKKRKTS